MLYKYYTIEICCAEIVLLHVQNQYYVENNYESTNIRTQLINSNTNINIIKYMDEKNNIVEYPKLFLSYDNAYNVLNNYYMNISNQYNSVIRTIKIVEILSYIQPPLTEMRKRKINKLV